MSRCSFAGLFLALSIQIPAAHTAKTTQPALNPWPLSVGSRLERRLAAGRSHTYSLSVQAGDYLHITIAQRGIDVVATLTGPDNHEVLAVDSIHDDFRAEVVVAIVNSTGLYTLAVRPAPSTTASGEYTIQIDDLRPAAQDDEIRVEAERAFERGRGLAATGRSAEYSKGLDEFQTALSRYRQVGDRRGEMKALIEIASLQYLLVRPEALASSHQAEQIARELGDRPATAAVLLVVGRLIERAGDLVAARTTFEQSLTISHSLDNRKAEATSLNDIGRTYGRSNDAEQAAIRFEQALPLLRATGDRLGESGLLNNLGNAYSDLGDFEKSIDSYRRSLAISRELHDAERQAVTLNNIGLREHEVGRDREALAHHLEALALSRESGGKETEARSLNTIGQTYYGLGDFNKALEYHRESLTIRREIGDISGQGTSLENEGRAWHRLGDDGESLRALHEALTIQRSIQEQYHERDTLHNLAVVERDRGDLEAAHQDIQATVDLDETLRSRITSPQLRTTFVAAEQNKYELFIDVLERQHQADRASGHDREALQVSERARARVLLDSLLDARVDLTAGVDRALLDRERRLEKDVSEASGQLSRALAAAKSTVEQRQAAADKVEALTSEFQRLEAEIRRVSPRYAAVTQPEPLSATDIQQRVIDEDTVLLEFALGEERSWLWAVTPRTVASFELPARRLLDAAARSLYRRFTARQRRRGEQPEPYAARVSAADVQLANEAADLSRMLLGSIAGQLNHEWRDKRLAIVASGALEYLPFASLPVPRPEDPSGARVQTISARSRSFVPLIAQHEIVTIPSASVIAILRHETEGRPRAPNGVAVLADPVFERDDPRLTAKLRLAATGGAQPPPSSAALARSAEIAWSTRLASRNGLSRLPFSRDEANAIVALAGPGKAFEAIDFQASRETVLSGALSDYRIVHFATHGVLDSERASLSGLVLSLVDETGKERDGYLRLHDIYNLRLGADLVVLSACQTALGKEFRGEGLVGLSRAFMYAGAPRVVASLWEVNDLATADLMKRFYRAILQRRLPPAAALRAAQLELMQEPRWTSPYYWAGFTLLGDWR